MLVRPFLHLLEILFRERKSEEAERIYDFCINLNEQATEAVQGRNVSIGFEEAAMEARKPNGELESLEEFIMRVESISAGARAPTLGNFS